MIIETDTKHLAFLIILVVVLPAIGMSMVFSHFYDLILIVLSVLIGLAFLSGSKKPSSTGSPTAVPMIEHSAETTYGRVLTSEVICSLCGHKNPGDALFCIKCGDYLDQSLWFSSNY